MKLLLVLTILFSIETFAIGGGSEIGNGGVGIYCEKKSAKVRLELFDLYEGRVLNNLKPIESKLDFAAQALSYAPQLDVAAFGKTVAGTDHSFHLRIAEVLGMIKLLPKGVGLVLTDDVQNMIYPKDCDLVQILNFKDDGFIYVDSDLWNQLSETQKAAAVLHEAIYSYLRRPTYRLSLGDGDKTSVRARRVVALLMAQKQLEPSNQWSDQNPELRLFRCSSTLDTLRSGLPGTHINVYAMPDGKNNRVEFTMLYGRPMVTAASMYYSRDINSSWMNLPLGYVQSLVDWDVQVQIIPTRPDTNTYALDIYVGRELHREYIDCSLAEKP